MRVIDFDSSTISAHKYAGKTGESWYWNLGGEEEEKYKYIPVRKVYIFHFALKLLNIEINFILYSPSSLWVLVEGTFPTLEAAECYVSFYMRKTEEIDKKKLFTISKINMPLYLMIIIIIN